MVKGVEVFSAAEIAKRQPISAEGVHFKRIIVKETTNKIKTPERPDDTVEKVILQQAFLQAGEKLAWHFHRPHVENAFYVIHGTGTIHWKKEEVEGTAEVQEGDFAYIGPLIHNEIINSGNGPLVMIILRHDHNDLSTILK